jgi:chromosome segregation ATPase
MRNDFGYAVAATVAVLGLSLTAPQPVEAAAKIVCWKDASGKTIGCGDAVPPEYRGAATKELDSRGVTRKTTESAEEAAKRRAQEQVIAEKKEEEERRRLEQLRQDTALISTFSSAREIDAKRDREIQTLDLQIRQQRGALEAVTKRHDELQARKEKLDKSKKPVPAPLSEDLARTAGEQDELEQSIAAKEREKVHVRQLHAEMKARYTELRGGGSPAGAKK